MEDDGKYLTTDELNDYARAIHTMKVLTETVGIIMDDVSLSGEVRDNAYTEYMKSLNELTPVLKKTDMLIKLRKITHKK